MGSTSKSKQSQQTKNTSLAKNAASQNQQKNSNQSQKSSHHQRKKSKEPRKLNNQQQSKKILESQKNPSPVHSYSVKEEIPAAASGASNVDNSFFGRLRRTVSGFSPSFFQSSPKKQETTPAATGNAASANSLACRMSNVASSFSSEISAIRNPGPKAESSTARRYGLFVPVLLAANLAVGGYVLYRTRHTTSDSKSIMEQNAGEKNNEKPYSPLVEADSPKK